MYVNILRYFCTYAQRDFRLLRTFAHKLCDILCFAGGLMPFASFRTSFPNMTIPQHHSKLGTSRACGTAWQAMLGTRMQMELLRTTRTTSICLKVSSNPWRAICVLTLLQLSREPRSASLPCALAVSLRSPKSILCRRGSWSSSSSSSSSSSTSSSRSS